MGKQIYAFAGKRGSGKSTASAVLIEKGFEDIKFADGLKNMLRALYQTAGVDSETIERKIEGDLKEEPCPILQGRTPRYAMQTLGTEWRNMLGGALWADILEQRINAMPDGARLVVSDYRFKDAEADTLERLGAHRVRIVRPLATDNDEYGQHASEIEVDALPVDMIVHNTGTIAELAEWVLDHLDAVEALARSGVLVDGKLQEAPSRAA